MNSGLGFASACGCTKSGNFINPMDHDHPENQKNNLGPQNMLIDQLQQQHTLIERADLSVRTTGLFKDGVSSKPRILDKNEPTYAQRKASKLTNVYDHTVDLRPAQERASAVDRRAQANTKNLYGNSNTKFGRVDDQPSWSEMGYPNTDLMSNPNILKVKEGFSNPQQLANLNLLGLSKAPRKK